MLPSKEQLEAFPPQPWSDPAAANPGGEAKCCALSLAQVWLARFVLLLFCPPAGSPSACSKQAEAAVLQSGLKHRLLPPGCFSQSTPCAHRALIRAVIWLSGAAVAIGSFPSVFAARARAVISLQECATASLLPAEGEGSTKILFGGIKSPAAYLSFTTVSPRLGLPLAVRARRKENSLSLSLVL